MFEKVKTTFNEKLFNKYKDIGNKSSSPIFIVGMPRSGTTLIEQILSSHPMVFGADEIDLIPNLIYKNFGGKNSTKEISNAADLDNDFFKKIGDNYNKYINELSNNSKRTTDKLPSNFLSIGFIKLILPKSKIIHCYRDANDNCYSIYKNYFPSEKMNYAYDINEIVEYYNLYNNLKTSL